MESVAGEKRQKKRKKEKLESADAERPHKPKKSKVQKGAASDFPNPDEDSSLNGQAHKALAYAYIQFSDPPSWKFNKARQNWLIRNMWSDQAIPDTYLPLLLRYLSNVKGGVRENLIKTCKIALAPLQTTVESASHTSVQTTSAKPTSDGEWKQTRAQAILDVMDLHDRLDQTI